MEAAQNLIENPSLPNAKTDDVVARALGIGTSTIIGAVTFWSLHGIRIGRADLRVALERIGLGFAHPKNPKPQAALRMAVEAIRKLGNEQIVFDRVLDSPDEVVYAMSSRSADEAHEVAVYAHKTRVRLDKKTGALQLEDSTNEALLAVAAKYAEVRDFITTTEFGGVLVNALRGRGNEIGLAAVNLRGDTGGVYFVPAGQVASLNALAELLDVVGGRGAITVWPIPSGERVITQAVDAAKVDFADRLTEARADVAELLASLEADKALDPEGRRVSARLNSFASIRARIGAYDEILGGAREAIAADLDALTKQIEARVSATIGADF